MSTILFQNAKIYDGASRAFLDGSLTVCDGSIVAATTGVTDTVIDCGGRRIIPGMVDVHTHGRAGFDFTTANADQLALMRRSYATIGTTTVIPTLASAPYDDLCHAIDRIRDAGFTALHLEGRYLNPGKRGAHDASLLVLPNVTEIEALIDRAHPMHIHLSAALELPEGREALRVARQKGATVGLAHSEATYEEAIELFADGVISATHLFNAMPPLHHRKPGMIAAALLTRGVYTELICDGLHVAPAMVDLTWRLKGGEGLVLITDSMEATGCADGEYAIAGSPVLVKDGRAVTLDGAIAGSTLNLYDGVRNLMHFASISLEEALPCATVNPARMMGLDDVGVLAPGYRADFCLLDADGGIESVYVGGEKMTDHE